MALRLRLCALLLVGLAAAAVASDRPPAKLHLVGNHWTAWNPPTSASPNAKVHIVEKGDTLWALAGKNLGNPYLWPQIWEKNQYVLDAHWIYPGDPIVLSIEVAPAAAVGATTAPSEPEVAATPQEQQATPEQKQGPDVEQQRQNTPVPLGTESDIYCSGFIGDLDESFRWSLTGSEYDSLTPQLTAVESWAGVKGTYGRMNTLKYDLTVGDVVYLDGGSATGLKPGMVLVVVEPREKVRHPVTGKVLGRFYAYRGRVRVLTAQPDRAIAEIVQGCLGLRVGDRLTQFQPEPVPLARPPLAKAVNSLPSTDLSSAPTIVRSESEAFTLGQDSVVFVDKGEKDDVAPGDIYTIYRMAASASDPPLPIGELAILSVKGRSSVARILQSRYPVYVGDRLERR